MKIAPEVIYEDNHLLIVNKPPGMLVQGDKTGDKTLTEWAKTYIKKRYDKPGDVFLNPAHRIDRPVSGLVIFGRTTKALERLGKMFQKDQIAKTYLTVIKGTPDNHEDVLVHYLTKNNETNVTKAINKPKGSAKRSELSYKLLGAIAGHSLLEVKPTTGRPHQIRVQLSKIGHPIEGDLKYGYHKPKEDTNISLHAYKLTFIHPVKKEEISLISKPNWNLYNSLIDELD